MTSQGINRRARFILAIALSFGLGTTIRKDWLTSTSFLDCDAIIDSDAKRGLCRAAKTTMGTGYAIGCLVALFLNAVLPADIESMSDQEILPLTEGEKEKEDSSFSNMAKKQINYYAFVVLKLKEDRCRFYLVRSWNRRLCF